MSKEPWKSLGFWGSLVWSSFFFRWLCLCQAWGHEQLWYGCAIPFPVTGWVLSEDPEKDVGFQQCFAALGVEFDLSSVHEGTLRIGNTAKRKTELRTVWSLILAWWRMKRVSCFAGGRMELYADIHLGCASICRRVGGHIHWEIFFWRRGISFRFGQFVSLSTEAIFSFNFWEAASIVSLGEAKNGFIFEIKFWLRVWSQSLSFLEFVASNSRLACEATGCEQRELSLLCCGSTSMIPAAKLWNKFLATGCSMTVYPWIDTCCLLGFKTMQRNCRGTSKCLQSCWGLEKLVLVSWKCHAVAWHHGLYEIWRQVCQWFEFALRLCSWSRMLAPGKSVQANLHAPRLPYVLIIYSLPVVFVCNALFLFLLLYFHMYKPQTNLVKVCAQLISLRKEHFFGDTFDVLCFHMYKLQAYFENLNFPLKILSHLLAWSGPIDLRFEQGLLEVVHMKNQHARALPLEVFLPL